jgi:flagellar hook-basal body complex protein FliE
MPVPIDSYAKAVAAYTKSATSEVALEARDEPEGSAFEQVLRSAMDGVVAQQKAAETQATTAVTTGADLTQVVTAVSEADVTLQSIVAIRDRVLESYKDIMRMPI